MTLEKRNFSFRGLGNTILQTATSKPHVSVVFLICITLIGFVFGVRYFVIEAKAQIAYDTAKTFQASIAQMHQYYSSVIEPRARAAGAGFEMDYKSTIDKLPFPATLSIEIGDELREVNSILSTKLYSNQPFPIREDRVLDQFEKDSLLYLENNPTSEFYRIETIDGVDVVRYAAPVILKQVCADCHNRPEFGFEGEWKAGEFRGARQVSMPAPNIAPIFDQAMISAFLLAIIASCVGGALVWPVVGRLHQSLKVSEGLNDELTEASVTKSRFLAAMSHDLRSPLTAILGFSSILRDSKNDELFEGRATSYADHIHTSGANLQALVDQLLEISSIEGGHWNIDETDIDLRAFVEETMPLLKSDLASKGIDVQTILPQELPHLHADARALLRILTNLVGNAGKYSNGSNVVIEFNTDEHNALILSVSDDGEGIPEEQIKTVQEFGGQANEGANLDEPGFGIGLWSVKALSTAHNAVTVIDRSPSLGGLRITVKFPPERSVSI